MGASVAFFTVKSTAPEPEPVRTVTKREFGPPQAGSRANNNESSAQRRASMIVDPTPESRRSRYRCWPWIAMLALDRRPSDQRSTAQIESGADVSLDAVDQDEIPRRAFE